MPDVDDSDGSMPLKRTDLTGLQYVEALRDGQIPLSPMANTIGYKIMDVHEGSVTLKLTPQRHLFNNVSLHGGTMATILDSAMSAAVNSALPKEARCRTLELKINYLDAPTADTGELTGKGALIQLCNRIALAEGRLEDNNGKLYAYATATFSIKRPSAES